MKSLKRLNDISKKEDILSVISHNDLMPLPFPYEDWKPESSTLTNKQKKKCNGSLDGFTALTINKPQSKEEEDQLVQKFIAGLHKLFSADNNWTFLQPLLLSVENCVKCQNCSTACPIYLASGQAEIYRPIYRSELFRRIVQKYIFKSGSIFDKLTGSDIELNWETISRLAELSYRCTICRKCTQVCPIGIDNGLITHEIRKLFSQEMGIAPKELHELGTMQQLIKGSSTGLTPKAFRNLIQFMECDIEDKTGRKISIPVDKEGADILLIHNSGEFLSWIENPEAFAIIFEEAGLDWTLSSEISGYEATNYGVWYDDVQLMKVAMRHAEIARNLKVKKIVIGECGHAHKALAVVADRVFSPDTYIPRESSMTVLQDLLQNGRIKVNPQKNDFPITLHDPCNMVRLMGVVEPQRRVLKNICTQFREMSPHGVDNYCCGGGSGFAIMNAMNFPDWKSAIAGRMKLKQIVDVFHDEIDPSIHKFVCAPCSNCKGQLRDIFSYYDTWNKCGILYGGLADLVVNAMESIPKPFITWEWH